MITYHSHIHNLAMSVSANAIALALSLADLDSQRTAPDYGEAVKETLPDLVRVSASLEEASSRRLAALPNDVSAPERGDHGLKRHLIWIRRRLDQGMPALCTKDAYDIADQDIPSVLERFERWYERHSSVHRDFYSRLRPLIESGQLNAALREAWVIFKSQTVEMFGISETLDGHSLAEELLGPTGPLVGFLPDGERMGYLNLFKGLYTLYRNPVAHNDVQPHPDEVDAVLILVNAALVKITRTRNESRCPS